MRVFVLDKNLKPLDPCHPARARELLQKGRAKVFKRYPFTVVLQDRVVENSTVHPHRIKIDPGSKTTGISVIQEETGRVTNALEVSHRGQQIKDSLESRRSLRRCRRNRKTRYRKPRFLNRTRKAGWLPPSLESRIANKPIEEFLKKKPEVLKRVLAQTKAPLKDAAAVNATRWELYRRLQSMGLPVEVSSGGRTKFNRKTRGIEKHHWTDAACVGASTPEKLLLNGIKPLIIKAKGHGRRQRCGTDRYGFPIRHAPAQKFFMGFQTGDLVKANVLTGKYAGIYVGRIAIRFKPSFKLTTGGKSFDVHPKYLTTIHKADGYEYVS